MILALLKTLLVRHFSLNGHWCFPMQLRILVSVDYLFVMRINYVFHGGHAAIAYFNVVFIEQIVRLVVSREVVIN